MKLCLINPPLISQKDDPHTGIVFMPFMLASLSAYLKRQGHDVQVLDAFGLAPQRTRFSSGYATQGLSTDEVVDSVNQDAEVIIIYFIGVVAYRGIAEIAKALRLRRPGSTLVLMENSQAVTAAALRPMASELLALGFECLLCGDPEASVDGLLEAVARRESFPKLSGLVFRRSDGSIFVSGNYTFAGDLDSLPFPDWKAFPLKNYWALGYAHGPMEGPYLSLLTSRGCPVPCRFCVIPSTNDRMWRFRSATNVVDEMEYWVRELRVTEFHIEDVNGTVRNDRMVEIARQIVDRGLRLKWKFVSGTKIECMKLETIPLLAQAGCTYISFSPETGSKDLLKLMDKPFRHDLACYMVELMHRHGIYSQACFVLGFPGETPAHVRETEKYITKLTRAGVDEIAQFIITPLPGSAIFGQFSGYSDLTQLTFSPTWRPDYRALHKRRLLQYAKFLFWKMRYHPRKLLRQFINVCRGSFETKMEQALYRVTFFRVLRLWRSLRTAFGVTR